MGWRMCARSHEVDWQGEGLGWEEMAGWGWGVKRGCQGRDMSPAPLPEGPNQLHIGQRWTQMKKRRKEPRNSSTCVASQTHPSLESRAGFLQGRHPITAPR